jgi:hypothetical protein
MPEVISIHAADALRARFRTSHAALSRRGARAEAWEAGLVAAMSYALSQALRVPGAVGRLSYGSPSLALADASKNLSLLAGADLVGATLGPGFASHPLFSLSRPTVTDLLQAARDLETACKAIGAGHDRTPLPPSPSPSPSLPGRR